MPSLTGVLETSLYVDDLDRASRFYEETFGLTRIEGDDRLRASSVGGRSVLLLLKRGASNRVTQLPEGRLGPHDGSGPLHLAFSVSAEDLPAWERLIDEREIANETRMQWTRGARSIYFRDPDNHSVEVATPGVWSIY